LLNVNEVHAFQAEGELVWIISASRKYLATQTLHKLQERLQALPAHSSQGARQYGSRPEDDTFEQPAWL
jgi:hypothetical protein